MPEIPGGLPGTTDALKSLATEHGLLGLLLFLAITALVIVVTLYLRQGVKGNEALAKLHDEYGKEIEKCAVQNQAIQEKRISESREAIQAIGQSAASFVELKRTIDTLASTSQQHADALRSVMSNITENRRYFEDRATRLEANLKTSSDALIEIRLLLLRGHTQP